MLYHSAILAHRRRGTKTALLDVWELFVERLSVHVVDGKLLAHVSWPEASGQRCSPSLIPPFSYHDIENLGSEHVTPCMLPRISPILLSCMENIAYRDRW